MDARVTANQTQQHTAQAERAAGIAMRFSNHLPNQGPLCFVCGLGQNLVGTFANLFSRCCYRVHQKPAQESLLHIGVQMRLKIGPGLVAAADQQPFKFVSVQQ